MSKTVPFTEEEVTKYLDSAIRHWRQVAASPETAPFAATERMASYYIDAFQSVRVSLFGELLPKESN